MAWPESGRHTDFAAPPAQEIVASAFLNELQDRIIELFGLEDRVEVTAVPEVAGATQSWGIVQSAPEEGWKCVTTGTSLHFFVRARHACTITRIRVKVYNSTGSPATIPVQIFKPTLNIGVPANGPALGSALFTNATPTAATAWDVVDSGALAINLDYSDDSGEYVLVVIGKNAASQANDKVAGIEVITRPFGEP